MADEKKPAGGGESELIIIGVAIVAVLMLPILLSGKYFVPTYLNIEFFFYQFYVVMRAIWQFIVGGSWVHLLVIILSILAILFIALIFYVRIRTKQKEEHFNDLYLRHTPPTAGIKGKNARWALVKEHMGAENENEWKLGIIEADSILEELLTDLEYPGLNIGEKLKGATGARFKSLNNAWEAHKVRNRIAHEGSMFTLTRPEARRAILNYELVFKEFDYI